MANLREPGPSDNIISGPTEWSAPGDLLPCLDFSNWDNEPLPLVEWGVFQRIPLRQTTLFSGKGAGGKSTIGLHLCCAHVLERNWLGAMPEPGHAFFFDCEDDDTIVHLRLNHIRRHYETTFAEIHDSGLRIFPRVGSDNLLCRLRNGLIEPTRLYERLCKEADDFKPRLICLANLANIFGGNEMDRGHVQQFVGLTNRLAEIAHGAVMLISHPSLTGLTSGSGISGSTQWFNAVRAHMYLRDAAKDAEDELPNSDLRVLEFLKNSYGSLSPSIALKWQNGLFLPEGSISGLAKLAREQSVDELWPKLLPRYGKLSSSKQSHSYAPYVLVKAPECKSAGITKIDLGNSMHRLLQSGTLRVVLEGSASKRTERLILGNR